MSYAPVRSFHLRTVEFAASLALLAVSIGAGVLTFGSALFG
jgi:hypothetical protein